jgi:hypothetical protein
VNISSIISYLIEAHEISSLQPFFIQNLDSLVAHKPDVYLNKAEKVMSLMGLKYYNYKNLQDDEKEGERRFQYASTDERFTKVSGYDYQFSISVFTQNAKKYYDQDIKLDSTTFKWKYVSGDWFIKTQFGNQEELSMNLKPLLLKLMQEKGLSNFNLAANDMFIDFEGEKLKGHFIIRGLQGTQFIKDDKFELSSIEGIVLLKIENEY